MTRTPPVVPARPPLTAASGHQGAHEDDVPGIAPLPGRPGPLGWPGGDVVDPEEGGALGWPGELPRGA